MTKMRNSFIIALILFMLFTLCINSGVVASESPLSSPSQAPSPSHQRHPPSIYHQAPEMPPLISPSNARAPSPQIHEHDHYEPPSVSPSQPPELPSHYYNEPPLSSPSPSPSPPPLFMPSSPSPSPVSPTSHYHHHHHGPHFTPPQSSQCWSHVMEVNDCSNEIVMAYHSYSRNLKPSCCQAINRTSRNCLFDMLFYKTQSTYFILWLQEHCARIANA